MAISALAPARSPSRLSRYRFALSLSRYPFALSLSKGAHPAGVPRL
jgi:hypothetical protein